MRLLDQALYKRYYLNLAHQSNARVATGDDRLLPMPNIVSDGALSHRFIVPDRPSFPETVKDFWALQHSYNGERPSRSYLRKHMEAGLTRRTASKLLYLCEFYRVTVHDIAGRDVLSNSTEGAGPIPSLAFLLSTSPERRFRALYFLADRLGLNFPTIACAMTGTRDVHTAMLGPGASMNVPPCLIAQQEGAATRIEEYHQICFRHRRSVVIPGIRWVMHGQEG